MRDFRLYVILDVDIVSSTAAKLTEIARLVISAGADILQLRAKGCPDRQVIQTGQAIRVLIQDNKTLFILNDRVDLVEIIGADGVHLGQEDLPLKYARDILGKDKIIGLSTHNTKQAFEAEKQGADYIGIGPIFTTATKPKTTPLGPAIIAKIKDKIKIPFVAIGGIKLDNLSQIFSFGGKRVAVCRAIITAKDVFGATQEFKRRLYLQ